MSENKEELMITVPYEDFMVGVQALQTIIAVRRLLKDNVGFASTDIRFILGLPEVKKEYGVNNEEQGEEKK